MTWTVSAVRSLLVGCALVVIAGCGSGENAQPADPALARKALQTVLDAWRAGEKPEDLEKLTPPIHVKDADWKRGLFLVSYQADQEGRLVGYDMNYAVLLELKNSKGTPVKKTAVYSITTRPSLLVARQEG
jgi:hypothetical protein